MITLPQRPAGNIIAALAAGAIGVFAFAPFYFWPAALVSLVGLFLLQAGATSKKRAALVGLSWGMGLFAAGVSWLYISLHEFGGMPAALSAFAIFIFCAYLSLFPMLAAVLAQWLRRGASPLVTLLVIFPATFVLGEIVRGWFLTGFPWLIMGYTQTPGGLLPAPLVGLAPIVGAFGISWVLALTAGVFVMCASRPVGRHIGISAGAGWLAAVALGLIAWSAPTGAPISVALLQGNISQSLKWREDQIGPTLQNYRDLVVASPAKLVVMPETALPYGYQAADQDYLAQMKAAVSARGGDLITGTIGFEPSKVDPGMRIAFNSAISVGAAPSQRYDKKHLVVFGEFVPDVLAWVMVWLNIPMSSLGRGTASPQPMQVADTKVAVNICYEDAFGSEIAVQLPEAEMLVNISNMAWFGHSLAAAQQAQFSQMRSLETARWSLRSTNTGLTAAINERGVIVKALPQYTRGALDVYAQPRAGATPYVRWRDWPVLVGLAIALGFALRMKSKAR